MAWSVAATIALCSLPAPAWADGPKEVGGHVGVATPLVSISKETKSISDQFTLLTPIGVTVKPGGKLAIDFEVVVANPISPVGNTGLVVDPGVVYNWGGFATGLRLAFQTNTSANVGLIPLINVGLADFGGSAWFIEAAFPTFIQSVLDDPTPGNLIPTTHHAQGTFNVVLHTGIGF
jgi:hypothetical protein